MKLLFTNMNNLLMKSIKLSYQIQHVSKKVARKFCHDSVANMSSQTNNSSLKMGRHRTSIPQNLRARIKSTGPITIADYMKEVLTNPWAGYYMNRDVLGHEGDFITSPEISQVFGEMIAVWCFSEWQKLGSPKPLQIVELGPGRGSLAEDVVRVFSRLGAAEMVSLHLVEISPFFSELQARKLCIGADGSVNDQVKLGENHYLSGMTKHGISIFWYHSVQEVPRYFSCFLAHEFFDALPVHKFQKTTEGWREILIDIDPAVEEKFRYVISRSNTAASKLFIKAEEKRNHIEVCPEGGVIMEHLAMRLEEDGGFALIADYGHDGTKTDTFRGFRHHQLHDPLVEPGSADLTADVDFSYLRDVTCNKVLTFGPVTQTNFLRQMGIDVRIEVLLQNCDEKQKMAHRSGYHMLMDADKMGDRFKFLALFPQVLDKHLTKFPVSGFMDNP